MKKQHNDFTEQNVVWTWADVKNGEHEFVKYHINHMISGDTDSSYLKYPQSIVDVTNGDIDSLVDIGDTIGEMTNEHFPAFCKRAFNCPDERMDIVQTERETVFDKGLFLSKKRYIIHVVDDEGERVDKLKIMGVEIKKSNTSKATKDILMGLVQHIIDGADEDEVKSYIADCKKSFKDYDISDIATPMNCKTLKEVQGIYNMTGEIKGHYAARAAHFYNLQTNEYDKQVNPGEKIGLLYIKHPKSKYIGYPLDANNLPDWLYEIQIDYDTMWSKTHKTITNYLESMEWDIKSKKNKVKEDLFGL